MKKTRKSFLTGLTKITGNPISQGFSVPYPVTKVFDYIHFSGIRVHETFFIHRSDRSLIL